MGKDAFSGLAGEIVRTFEPKTEADPAAILLHTLAGFGNAIGSGPYMAVQNDRHPARIYVAIVGDSGKGRKGTSWSGPRELLRRCEEFWAKDRIRTGLSSGEGLIYHVRDGDGRDAGVADKRLLAIEPEFSVLLKIMGREGNSLSGVLRQAWDTGNLSTLTRNNPLMATDAHFSLVGHTTKEKLLRNLDGTEKANGFANRILWCVVRRSKLLPDGDEFPERELDRLAQLLKDAIDAAKHRGVVRRDKLATEIWREVYGPLSEGQPGLSGAILNRAEAQVLRLSLIYALLDRSDQISANHLQAALAVWDYCEASVLYLFGDRTGDPVADRIIDELRRVPDGLSDDEVGKLFGYHRTSEKDRARDDFCARPK